MVKAQAPESVSRGVKISAGLVILLAVYVYQLQPTIMAVPMNLSPLPPAPTSNGLLSKMKHMYRTLDGAESLLIDDGKLYTGLVDGQVVEIDLSQGKFAQVERITFTGDPQRALPYPCGKFDTQPICGRPIGVAKNADGKLVVADAYLGLLSVDPSNGKIKLLSKKPDEDKLKKFIFLNDLAVSQKNGDVYFTETSSRRQLRLAMYEQFEARAFGRIFKYNAKKKKSKTLLKNVAYPTGMLVAPNDEYLLVAERAKNRISKIPLDKKAKLETWSRDLPIWPERITWDVDGEHVWVAGHPRHGSFSIMQWLGEYPGLRSLIAKCMYPSALEWFLPSGSLVLRLDRYGKVVNAFDDYSGRTGVVSGVYPSGNDLYFSMVTNPNVRYVGHMTRQELGLPSVAVNDDESAD